jgi:hypothetical protein
MIQGNFLAKKGLWVYIVAVIAALIQVYAWFKLLRILVRTQKEYIKNFAPLLRSILTFACIALSLKFILQLSSTIPSLGEIVFIYRPIVIAYLHLVLLAVNSLFLLFYIYANHFIIINKKIKIGVIIFAVGIFLNEVVLGLQGVIPFGFPTVPYTNQLLFVVAIILLLGSGLIAFFSIKKTKQHPAL